LPAANFYVPGDKITLGLDTIKQVRSEGATDADGRKPYSRLIVSDDHHDDIIVTKAEADAIDKDLLNDGGSQLAREVEHLTSAVRDLWQLLRARLR
jgi:hypothetical protein